MALSLGVQKGQKIRIDGMHMLVVEQVFSPERVRIRFGNRQILVTESQREELMPEVFVSIGRARTAMPNSQSLYTRLAFEAPRSIRIERV